MKRFKPLAVIALLISAVAMLSGCLPPEYMKYGDSDAENVSSVEFYDLRNLDPNERYSDFLETENAVYTLESDKHGEFLGDLAEIQFSTPTVFLFAPPSQSFCYGEWVVRINHSDGAYTLISNQRYGETYSADGELADSNHFGCDDGEWTQFIAKYLPAEIFGE